VQTKPFARKSGFLMSKTIRKERLNREFGTPMLQNSE
jgi:hypothetical protein